jgi:hypothetical protein
MLISGFNLIGKDTDNTASLSYVLGMYKKYTHKRISQIFGFVKTYDVNLDADKDANDWSKNTIDIKYDFANSVINRILYRMLIFRTFRLIRKKARQTELNDYNAWYISELTAQILISYMGWQLERYPVQFDLDHGQVADILPVMNEFWQQCKVKKIIKTKPKKEYETAYDFHKYLNISINHFQQNPVKTNLPNFDKNGNFKMSKAPH